MPPKAKMPAPIDRPLSRAYLRQFAGWSTEYPPGVSEPTSQRVMENMLVNRQGSIRVRPGLRHLTYEGSAPADTGSGLIGSHEVFFLDDGRKAYLYAQRTGGSIHYRVAFPTGNPATPLNTCSLTSAPANFANSGNISSAATYVRYLQIDNKIVPLTNEGDPLQIFHVGEDKKVIKPTEITKPIWSYVDKPTVRHPDPQAILDPVGHPALYNNSARGEGFSTLGLDDEELESPDHSIGYYYTFSNEFGESLPSMVRVIRVRRPYSRWRWEGVDQTREVLAEDQGDPPADPPIMVTIDNDYSYPNGEDEQNPALVADQLLIWPSEAAYTTALAEGATHINVYAIMWNNQDPVPVEGVLVGVTEIGDTPPTYEQCWVRHSPDPYDHARTMVVPTGFNRVNYTIPPKPAQGLVAADRMILVNDRNAGAVVRWTSNQFGEYTNFTANRGGGYKTLTTGNIYIPASVKLWQNPQSADTITIMCLGVDGLSTSFYMAPAQVASQSDATNIMGFEETTATPGTVSPYGCEVVNNALYHPLEDALVKSTASNYNINHKAMTDLIREKWTNLDNKQRIVSSVLDNRIYFLVHNPEGEALEAGCMGNEVWVVDTQAKDGGAWNRWLVQGCSLRKIEVEDRVYMSIVKPEGLYCFDENRSQDDYVSGGAVLQRPIPWKFETNTQGANRAHDAWARLQQVNVTLGNFSGRIRWGVRGYDINGREQTVSKETREYLSPGDDGLPWDFDDVLLVRRDMKEWRFFAESVPGQASAGQVSLVQYKYTPVTVNVGYEYGSVETFEYGNVGDSRSTTVNGVPTPMADTTRP